MLKYGDRDSDNPQPSILHSTNLLQRLRVGRNHLRPTTPTTAFRPTTILPVKHIALPHHHMVNIDLRPFEPATPLAVPSSTMFARPDLPLMRINNPPNQHAQHRPTPYQTRPIHCGRIQITPRQTRQTENRNHQRRKARARNTNRIRELS